MPQRSQVNGTDYYSTNSLVSLSLYSRGLCEMYAAWFLRDLTFWLMYMSILILLILYVLLVCC